MRALPFLALALLLSGCGFQLRGTADLPFDTVFVSGSGGIVLDIKRNIQAGSRTLVVDDPKTAQAVLEFTQESRQKDILSLSAAGRVREFRLLYRVGFRVHDGKGGEYLPVSTLQLARDITYSDADVLAKETEEQLLYRDMQSDMVRQIIRRLAEAKKPKPVAQ
ncbi:MAG TPA: LPS assembly lipoprotein LptE [Burkholderiales bacterium]|jgi:LPS-assembly lipoprotein|nr:LPS assembly lipoprotein LptE [Burkholderiales bacterium]